MYENRYCVIIDGEVCAKELTIEHALILVKSLFESYYNDHLMTISIREMERTEGYYEKYKLS